MVTERCGAGDAVPNTAACSSRSAQIFSKEETSSHRPRHSPHSRTVVEPIVTDCMSTLQRGHLRASSSTPERLAAAAPQRGQCLLPINIMPKHEAHAIVARREPQYRHWGASVAVAAPHIGQLRVSACICGILPSRQEAGLPCAACAMLCASRLVISPTTNSHLPTRKKSGPTR
jgi:hypothetical protein